MLNITLTGSLMLVGSFVFAQKNKDIPIHPIHNSSEFIQITQRIASEKNALYVFDIDNTLLITNDNMFGSDWWYEQTTKDPDLKLNVSSACLFGALTPLFYATFSTTPVFVGQQIAVDLLGQDKSRTIALTSRGYTRSVATSTELELTNNHFDFLRKDSATLAKDVVMLNGVIYTKGQNKGKILLEYVEDHAYDKIYYFDDSESKVKAVQQSFNGKKFDISIYHMLIAQKIPYTPEEIDYMKAKLCNLIETINQTSETSCNCNP